MKNELTGYYPYDEQQLAELWSEGLFVFDSSVLLGLYRYSERTRKDLMTVLRSLGPRIWIPHQVALEYQENRLSVIRDQSAKYDEVILLLMDTKKKLVTRIQQLQLGTRHSLINPANLIPKIDESFDELLSELRELGTKHPDMYQHDYIRAELDELFDGRVGPVPESQESLDEIYNQGLERYINQCPPGYGDSSKEKELKKRGEPTAYFYNGLRLEKKFGDLILWQQMLAELKTRENVRHVALVTDDKKDDWWWKEKRPRSRQMIPLGARPELVQEVTAIPGITLFQMYRSDSFMDAAQEHFQLGIVQDSIDDARTVLSREWDARLVREALEEMGPLEIWQLQNDENVQAWLVQLEDGRAGVTFVERTSGIDWKERTAFVPRNGTLEQVRDFLGTIAARVDESGS